MDLTFDDLIPQKKVKATELSFDDLIPKEDPGVMGAMSLGIGREMSKLYEGAKQKALTVGAQIPGSIGQSSKESLAKMADTEKFRDEAYAGLQRQHPYATMAGESLPLMAVPMGNSVKAAAALGALPGLLEFGTTGESLQRGAAGALGGGVGYGIGKAVGNVISPAMKAPDEESARLAGVLAKEGVPLDAAQATGNPVLQNMKAVLSRIPWTASGQQAKDAAQNEAFTAAALRRLGSNAKAATPDVMADAYSNTVRKMEGAANSVALTMDDPAVAGLATVEKNYLRRLPTDQKSVIASYLDDLSKVIGETGAIPGDVYNKTRSELGRLAANTDNISLREGAKGIQRVLDDAFDRQAPAEAVQAMKEARSEYAKYLTMEKALQKGRVTNGQLPPKQLYAQAQQDIPGFTRGGGGDFADLTRAGRRFIPDPVPNSGTAQQLMYQNLLTAGSMSGLGALGGALMPSEDGKSHAIPGAALGLLGFGTSKAAQKILNSPQLTRYLMSEALTEEQKRLLAQRMGSMGLLGAAAAN